MQVLELESMISNGTCIRHMSALSNLRQLSLQGSFELSFEGLAALARVSQHLIFFHLSASLACS